MVLIYCKSSNWFFFLWMFFFFSTIKHFICFVYLFFVGILRLLMLTSWTKKRHCKLYNSGFSITPNSRLLYSLSVFLTNKTSKWYLNWSFGGSSILLTTFSHLIPWIIESLDHDLSIKGFEISSRWIFRWIASWPSHAVDAQGISFIYIYIYKLMMKKKEKSFFSF